jgi:hypothetical protein
MTPRITHRPLKCTPRRNAEGLWRCYYRAPMAHARGAYLKRGVFHGTAQIPPSFCASCFNRYRKIQAMRHARSEAWWTQERARNNRNSVATRARQRRERRTERGTMARAILGNLERRGWSQGAIERVTRVGHETQQHIKQTGELKYPDVLDRLVLLQIAAREIPVWERPTSGVTHPHLAQIQYRYEALRAAHAD